MTHAPWTIRFDKHKLPSKNSFPYSRVYLNRDFLSWVGYQESVYYAVSDHDSSSPIFCCLKRYTTSVVLRRLRRTASREHLLGIWRLGAHWLFAWQKACDSRYLWLLKWKWTRQGSIRPRRPFSRPKMGRWDGWIAAPRQEGPESADTCCMTPFIPSNL